VTAIDLGAYFARIGYHGPRAATLEVLEAVHHAHPNAIPFENLNPFLGQRIDLEPAALEDKLVRRKRGGYCFEQNGLLLLALRALGFRVTPLAARVVWMQPDDAPQSPLSHMLLIAHLSEGDYLCDVGFGGQSPIAPLRLEAGLEQKTPHGTFRLEKTQSGYELALRIPERWAAMYRFSLEAQSSRDYEVYNWFTSTHPASRFVNNLVAARIAPEARYALLNREFAIHHTDGRTERSEIKSVQQLGAVLADIYGIAPEAGEIDRLWAKVSKI
jgi:N-hydroxyarylamine O-acetyltransferase